MASRPLLLGLPSALLILLGAATVHADGTPSEGERSAATIAGMKAALQQAAPVLSQGPDPAYYTALSLVETRQVTIAATHGALAGVEQDMARQGDIDLRVGTMALDNTRKILDAGWFSAPRRDLVHIPFGADAPVQRNAWLRALDDTLRQARQQLVKVRANEAVKVEREDSSDDFSPAPPVVADLSPPGLYSEADAEAWAPALRAASRVFLDHPEIEDSTVQLQATREERWLVTNEGTTLHDGRTHYRVSMWAKTTAPDGMQLDVYDYEDVADPARLPAKDHLVDLAEDAARRLVALRGAPTVEPYVGPAILRGRAAGVFFHEIFGHRIEGHRQKDEDEGQTFTHRVGQPILPAFLSVVDDPTLPELAGHQLNGTYRWDSEGVAAERVELVTAGVLRNFLMSRAPIEGFPRSNGHGRRQPGNAPTARQGNLLVQASQSVPYGTLRKMLLDEVRKQGKPFGLIFDDISGGFTFTGRSEPNAFVVKPVTVWKAYADGRPDELVRGVDLIGTPLTTFARIVAAGDDTAVFNGVCGAESGWVPVSAASPSLLVSEVEVQRHEKDNDRPPLLPPPLPSGEARR